MSLLTCAVAVVASDEGGRVLLCRQHRGRRRWGLPGGRATRAESPVSAAVREFRAETGLAVEIVDLIGIYQLDGGTEGPEVVVHVFRGRVVHGPDDAASAARGCRVGWHDPAAPPEAVTPTTRLALADARAGRSGVLRRVPPESEPPAGPSRVPAPSAPVAGG